MSTTVTTEKVTIVPLFTHDGVTMKEDGSYTGVIDIITKPRYSEGVKVIADVKPYGGNFSNYEEAKTYAKLFAASPDMYDIIKELYDWSIRHNTQGAIFPKLAAVINKMNS